MAKQRVSEAKYSKLLAEFKLLALEMKAPGAVGRWKLSVKDSSGCEIENRELSSQSWTRNYYNQRANEFLSIDADDAGPFGTGAINYERLGGALRQVPISGVLSLNNLSAANDSFGILLGSASKAEDFDDPTFGTQISHGRAGGELYYYGTGADSSLINATWNSGDRIFTSDLKRAFGNFSGGNVTVRELGVVPAPGYADSDIMTARDVLPSDLIIPNRNILIVSYFMESLVYPS